jgi:Acetyltransferase (GNAT) domain
LETKVKSKIKKLPQIMTTAFVEADPRQVQPMRLGQLGPLLAAREDKGVAALTSWKDLAEWEPFWRANSRHLETDLDFVSLVVRTRKEVRGPYVLAVADRNGAPKALMIGRLEQTRLPLKFGYLTVAQLPVRQLVFVTDGLIGERSGEVVELVTEAIGGALRSDHAQVAVLENVGSDSPFHRVRDSLGRLSRGLALRSHPHWRGMLPENGEQFLRKLSKRHRYKVRHAVKALETTFRGQLTYRQYSLEADVQPFCAAAEAITRTSYQRGLGVGFIDNEQNRALVQLSAHRRWWNAWVLFIQERPVAFWSGMAYGGVFHVEWTAFDPAYGQSEPGTVLFLKLVDSLCQAGVRQVDFGIGSALYKERFGDQFQLETNLRFYAPSLKGIGLNVCYSSGVALETLAQRALRRIRLADRLRRLWRSRAEAGRTTQGLENGPGSDE